MVVRGDRKEPKVVNSKWLLIDLGGTDKRGFKRVTLPGAGGSTRVLARKKRKRLFERQVAKLVSKVRKMMRLDLGGNKTPNARRRMLMKGPGFKLYLRGGKKE